MVCATCVFLLLPPLMVNSLLRPEGPVLCDSGSAVSPCSCMNTVIWLMSPAPWQWDCDFTGYNWCFFIQGWFYQPNIYLLPQVETREDEEQNVKLAEILELLVAAGYFRARIKGLSPFDKVRGNHYTIFWQYEMINYGRGILPNSLWKYLNFLFKENSNVFIVTPYIPFLCMKLWEMQRSKRNISSF